MTRDHAIQLVIAERDNQIDKFGHNRHHPMEYVALIAEELGEVSKVALENHFCQFYPKGSEGFKMKYLRELTQIAALAIQAIESIE